jgi:hypothetical protein
MNVDTLPLLAINNLLMFWFGGGWMLHMQLEK